MPPPEEQTTRGRDREEAKKQNRSHLLPSFNDFLFAGRGRPAAATDRNRLRLGDATEDSHDRSAWRADSLSGLKTDKPNSFPLKSWVPVLGGNSGVFGVKKWT